MSRLIETINQFAENWFQWMVPATWQGLIVLGLVLLVFAFWRSATPRWRYGLLFIALVKFILPPIALSLIGFFAWLPQLEVQPVASRSLTSTYPVSLSGEMASASPKTSAFFKPLSRFGRIRGCGASFCRRLSLFS